MTQFLNGHTESSRTIDRFVVVDVETTGVYNNDRIVEVAAVSVDLSGKIVDEWDTLVDPKRDVGPSWLHGVTATMVTNAPTFDEVGGALAARLDGAILVGHNLPFDTRFITNEYQRVGGDASPGSGVDTMKLMGGRLSDLCSRLGVEIDEQHRALCDARATAKVLVKCFDHVDVSSVAPSRVIHQLPTKPRTLRREAMRPPDPSEIKPPFLGYLGTKLKHESADGRTLAYLELLDWALADLVLDPDERQQLRFLAHALGLEDAHIVGIHEGYMTELASAAMRDGVITDEEVDQLQRASIALDVPWELPEWHLSLAPSAAVPDLTSATTVCFTGDAGVTRAELEDLARRIGLKPIGNVTKKCSLLVAVDPHSRSGKAAKARQYGTPIMAVSDFLADAQERLGD